MTQLEDDSVPFTIQPVDGKFKIVIVALDGSTKEIITSNPRVMSYLQDLRQIRRELKSEIDEA
ncbi:MAG: hypothetical protein K2X81_05540 [Candidatus Obscuribacterales bacterium]|nr:hypothetical protein [Candidatus Obscuribacterales bacterium]